MPIRAQSRSRQRFRNAYWEDEAYCMLTCDMPHACLRVTKPCSTLHHMCTGHVHMMRCCRYAFCALAWGLRCACLPMHCCRCAVFARCQEAPRQKPEGAANT